MEPKIALADSGLALVLFQEERAVIIGQRPSAWLNEVQGASIDLPIHDERKRRPTILACRRSLT